MECNKKGASAGTPAPNTGNVSNKNHLNYNRLVNLCLSLLLIAIVIFAVGYIKDNDRLVFFGLGMMTSNLFLHISLHPIREDK